MHLDLTLWEQLLPLIIPVLATLAIRFFAWLDARLPKWVVPAVVVPLLGAASQAVAALLTSGEVDPLKGVLLGGLAVFIREVTNKLTKVRKAVSDGRPVSRMP